MMIHEAPHLRKSVQGVQVLLYDTGPYVEVAERIRLVHKMGKMFSVEKGEVLSIHDRWFYRASLILDGNRFLGDAEIHFDAPPDTPDGTNPLTCGQTSAVGNALKFAGFGTLRSIFVQQGWDIEAEENTPSDETDQMRYGIKVVMIDETPYVSVDERLISLYRAGKTLSMDSCGIYEYNGVWIYRACVSVDGKAFVGDAEIFFGADPTTIDGRYPISTAQTSALGNALAFAGFGDVRSILERLGKDANDRDGKPMLASADAVLRAKQRAERRVPRQSSAHGVSQPEKSKSTQSTNAHIQPRFGVSAQQQATIRVLCERLGESEPNYATLTAEAAEQCLRRLQRQEEELFREVDEALQQEANTQSAPPSAPIAQPPLEVVSTRAVGHLKDAWLKTYHVQGTQAELRACWQVFKREVCQTEVDDMAMSQQQHDQLTAALKQQAVQPLQQPTSKARMHATDRQAA